ncbi:MAG TPA: hypothetical protein VKM55_30380 [Candidatus Lokiarchaeia archaeon]|nr:hypothetical protein [Candidatus Lokiarchaeia archaeon]
MPGSISYDVYVKPVDVNYVHNRIKERYIDFFTTFVKKSLDNETIEQEVITSLSTAMIDGEVDELNPDRCGLKKLKIRGFSSLLQTEVSAIVFQDDIKKIRFPITILSNPMESWFKGIEYKM